MDYTSAPGYVVDSQNRRQFADRDLANNIPGTSAASADMNGIVNSAMYIIKTIANMEGNAADDTLLGGAILSAIASAVATEAATRANNDAAIRNWAASSFLSLTGGQLTGDVATSGHISVNVAGGAWNGNQSASDNPVGAAADGWLADGRSIYHFSKSTIPMFIGTGANGPVISFCVGGGNQIGSITSNGASVAYNTTSDHRAKIDVQELDLDRAAHNIQALRPVSHKWREAPDRQATHGFIAHELQAVAPHAVTGEKDATSEDGNPVMQQVDLAKLVPDIVAALQHAQRSIARLEEKIETIQLETQA